VQCSARADLHAALTLARAQCCQIWNTDVPHVVLVFTSAQQHFDDTNLANALPLGHATDVYFVCVGNETDDKDGHLKQV
jgi:hypothetical protein